jgi:para-nitrobenzyl esterase
MEPSAIGFISRTSPLAPFAVAACLTACGGSAPPVDVAGADAADGASACVASPTSDPAVVRTTTGTFRGSPDGGSLRWLGIRFARAARRWAAPTPAECPDGVQDAAEWPAICEQNAFESAPGQPATATPGGQPDCLALNVWRPAAAGEGRPVLVYIHGGGNSQGSSSQLQANVRLFDGALLATRMNAIVVTIQYRVGPFGFLAHPALADEAGPVGNYGLLDQQAALRWVQSNIAAFGGDRARVMLFGESAGALDTCMHLVSPLARGLFSSALMQSGGCVAATREQREADAIAHATALGCPSRTDRACLERLTRDQWLSRVEPPFSGGVVSLSWGPTIDGFVLPDAPEAVLARGAHNHVPFVIGSNAAETGMSLPLRVEPADVVAFFARFPEPHRSRLSALYPPGATAAEARRALVRATTDAQFTCGARRIARAVATHQPEPVHRYFFDHRVDGAAGALFGATHGLELFFVFQTIERSAYAMGGLRPEDAAVAATMGARWVALARDGYPQDPSGPRWPTYTATDPTLVIAPTVTVSEGPRNAECDAWDALAAR